MSELDDQIEKASQRLRELRRKRAELVVPARRALVVKKACRHQPLAHFKISENEWRCSACKREGVWTDSWSYLGCISCRKCHAEPAIELVACSDKCIAALEKEPDTNVDIEAARFITPNYLPEVQR